MKKVHLLFLLWPLCVRAQQGDTSNVKLQSVTINGKQQDNESFTFYRSSRLSSTEEILARMPGVNLTRRGPYGMEPMLRTYSAGQVNLTIDGMKMYGACTDKMDPVSVYIEPNNLETIRLEQGAGGAAAGSTIGGGLDFVLKKPEFGKRALQAQFIQSYSTVNNGYKSSLSLQSSTKRMAFRLGSVYRKAQDYKAGGNETVAFSGYEKLNLSAGVAYKLSEKHLLKADYLADLGWNMGYPALTMDVGRATAHIVSLSHLYTPNRAFLRSAETKLYYNRITHEMDDSKRPAVPMHMDMPGWSETMGAYHELQLGSVKHRWFVRGDVHRAYTRADMTMYPPAQEPMYMQTLPPNVLVNAGLSLRYSWEIDSSQSLQVSSRLDHYYLYAQSSTGSRQWEGMNEEITAPLSRLLKNAAVVYRYRWTRKFSTVLTLAYGERLPTANERLGFYLYNRLDGYDYLGNPTLQAEQAKQAELTLRYTGQIFNTYVTGFYHDIGRYINAAVLPGYTAMTIGAAGVKSYTNTGNAVLQGFEAGATLRLLQQLQYMGSARYTYGTLTGGLPMQQVPPLKLQQALRLQTKLLLYQVEYDYAHGQERINPASGELATPSWHLVNLRVSKNFVMKRLILQAGIACENIFDIRYREHLDWRNIPRPGRNVDITLGILVN